MDRDDITVVYAAGDVRLSAHIRLEQDDEKLLPESWGGDHAWIELTEGNVKPHAFTAMLRANARATETLWLWCYRPVWLKLLDLLDVHPPLPDTVEWPKKGRGRA
jgi:hypothetical protein